MLHAVGAKDRENSRTMRTFFFIGGKVLPAVRYDQLERMWKETAVV